MHEHLNTNTDNPRPFTPEAFPIQTDIESDSFEPLDEETARELGLKLTNVPVGELTSPNFDDEDTPPGDKWRLIKYAPSRDGIAVLNLETWDLNPGQYYGLNKGPFRRSTIHQRQDSFFGYMGEMDHDIHPMSRQAGRALLGMLPETPEVEYNETMDEEEMLDVVNKDDEVIGVMKRSEIRTLFGPDQGRYVRYANCFLQNSQGQLWVPKRTATKKIAPSGLDFGASEHVQSGETYLQAIKRGLGEELNVDVNESDIQFIGKIPPNEERRSFSSIYVIRQDVAPKFNENDFVSYEWLSIDELRERLSTGIEAKYDLAPAIALL